MSYTALNWTYKLQTSSLVTDHQGFKIQMDMEEGHITDI